MSMNNATFVHVSNTTYEVPLNAKINILLFPIDLQNGEFIKQIPEQS